MFNKKNNSHHRRNKNGRHNDSRKSFHSNAPNRSHVTNNGQNDSNKNGRPQGANQRNGGNGASETNNVEGLARKYDFLLEQHINARKKFFEMYFRADKAQKIKLEKHLQSAREQLYNFDKEINYSTKKLLDKRNGAHPFIDTYAKEHGQVISHFSEDSLAERFTDPHRLPTQKNGTFKDDTEESVGTLEDYKKVKNL
ncbi:MAG: hypothetical protein A2504_15390 [Bdellovibrionales bacterium RIFOXYD12_FULL_39_22]|nr:MAG: hypothetical protein A2385_02820 [Bdellovibrionales bacterium RIFOXYB1_FULL_39_21]OFZ43179.1 MAG: hypothetical protein A2485_11965 [Bdellovibrionales bacterium RIFOXYC12_FULL_39_17]OFZ47917.1 MAG: hypothetical protein A2404_16605 [Bdellovibrionales bacterium RIFOXYC1_FULL_39_130]OFZ70241.1 MAG: hypothetical protein A2451_02510 [Bdellovibrionales bacterium RIFOXYC2_FULL_39_8]OFZ75697.1 MAG: hypothetical protein A2560_13105 [Bdellovibrionales bacterium RIFOXYD1_FULL_39_84]OFZ94187.1 MAG: